MLYCLSGTSETVRAILTFLCKLFYLTWCEPGRLIHASTHKIYVATFSSYKNTETSFKHSFLVKEKIKNKSLLDVFYKKNREASK